MLTCVFGQKERLLTKALSKIGQLIVQKKQFRLFISQMSSPIKKFKFSIFIFKSYFLLVSH